MSSASERAARGLIVCLAAVVGLAAGRAPAAVRAPAAPDVLPFTAQQVAAGGELFARSCAECHGAGLQGVSAPPLRFAADDRQPAGALFRFAVERMPPAQPHGLRDQEYVALLAFIASRNGYAPGARPLTVERARASSARFPRLERATAERPTR